MTNTLPASAAITTKDLIGFVLYLICYISILAFIRPHQLRFGLYPAFVTTITVFVGILIWAVTANGGVGELILSNTKLTAAQRGFTLREFDFEEDYETWDRKLGRKSPGSQLDGRRGMFSECDLYHQPADNI